MKLSIECCESFVQIIPQLTWMSFTRDEDGEKIYVMPTLRGSDNNRYRINHCPVCGAEVRSIEITDLEI